jgi:hypothetical protein
MKLKMLGKDIEVTRKALLGDGYCLSTIKHAERLTSGPSLYEVKDGADSAGAAWLKEHVRYCRQCLYASRFKGGFVSYLEGHYPNLITRYMQGELFPEIIGSYTRLLLKKEPELMRELMGILEYNFAPPNMQAAMDYNVLRQALNHGRHGAAVIAQDARVTRVDTELLFEAWQLLGSAPEYGKERLIADWKEGKLNLAFPVVYFSFSEGINDHLIGQFFDNMPHDIFGLTNVHGILAAKIGKKSYMLERGSLSEKSDAADREAEENLRGSADARSFLWACLIRAMNDGVFQIDHAEGMDTHEQNVTIDTKGHGAADRQAAPNQYYSVVVNPSRSFKDPTRVYGKRHINWTHRWNVAGHWRTYKNGNRVWIGGYVKGPDDKPLIQSVRVYSARGFVARTQNRVAGWFRWIADLFFRHH